MLITLLLVIIAICSFAIYNLVAHLNEHTGKTRWQVNGLILLLACIAISASMKAWWWLITFAALGALCIALKTSGWKGFKQLWWILPVWWVAIFAVYHKSSPTPEPAFPAVIRDQILIPNDDGSETITLNAGEYLVVDITACHSQTQFDGPVDLLVTENGQDIDWGFPNGMWGKVSQADVSSLGIKTQLPLRLRDAKSPKPINLSPDNPIVFYRTTPEDPEVKIAFQKRLEKD